MGIRRQDDTLPGAFLDEHTPLPRTKEEAELEMATATCNDLRSALASANAIIVEQREAIKRLRGERDTLAARNRQLMKTKEIK